jgi:predicted PurR-regulated permease PerM
MRDQAGWFTRERLSVLTLLAATALALWLCFLLARPFLPALAWALALAIVAEPLYERLARRLRPGLAAFAAVALVAVALAGPFGFVMQQVVQEASHGADLIEKQVKQGTWIEDLRNNRHLRPVVRLVESRADLEDLLNRASGTLANLAKVILAGSAGAAIQFAIALFVLFFMLRDRAAAVARVRSLMPLSGRESGEILTRIKDTIHAAVFGQVAVAAVQGALGGIVFAILGLPAPAAWGFVMFVLSVIPMLGAFVVWGPVSVYLAATGQWGKAIMLAAFGTVVIGLIDNLLYPMLVGRKLRLHTVLVFFSIVGGLSVFGASGVVLGPVVLATTMALLDVWCARTSAGRAAEAAVETRRAS